MNGYVTYQAVKFCRVSLIAVMLLSFFSPSRAQRNQAEDYITTNSGILMATSSSDFAESKGASLFFTDNDVILWFKEAKKTVHYNIYKKFYDDGDQVVRILCFDSAVISTKTPEELKNTTPTLIITIDYNAKMNGKPFPDVVCWFAWKGVKYNFGTGAKSEPDKIQLVRAKYKGYLRG